MIFRPELAKLVRQGRKTQTRRLADGDKACTYQPGRVVAVQPGRGKRAMARVLIVDVKRQPLSDITEQDARAEGFTSRSEFFAYWRVLHRLGLPEPQRDLLLRLVDAPAATMLPVSQLHPGLPDTAVRSRLGRLERHGYAARMSDGSWDITEAGANLLTRELGDEDLEQPVWAITFRLAQVAVEAPTLLTPAARPAGTSHGYTARSDQAMFGEPEAIDPDRLHFAWRTQSTAEHVAARHGGASIDVRLARARELAQRRNVDLGQLELALEKRVRAIENKAMKAA